jgi:lipid II:glycine glycyltransferase (peptidoglycan interpeptide bridge formation enzyme)
MTTRSEELCKVAFNQAVAEIEKNFYNKNLLTNDLSTIIKTINIKTKKWYEIRNKYRLCFTSFHKIKEVEYIFWVLCTENKEFFYISCIEQNNISDYTGKDFVTYKCFKSEACLHNEERIIIDPYDMVKSSIPLSLKELYMQILIESGYGK